MSNTFEFVLAEIFPVSISGEWGSDPSGEGNALALRAADFTKDCKLRSIIGAPRNIPDFKLGSRILRDGDILIEKSGGSPDQPVGRVVFFDRAHEGRTYVHSNFLQLLRTGENFDSKFTYYLMAFLYFSGLVFRYQQQTTGIINLKLENYLMEKVSVPALPIQKRIQRILSTIDQTIEKTEALIEKYRHIKAGLMHDLFTRGIGADGKLRPPREQAPDLYQETSIGWIPKEWGCVKASKICYSVTKGTTPSSFDNNSEDSVPYIRVENLSFDGSLTFEDDSLFVIKHIHFSELMRSRIYPGDVLINIVGPPLGKASLVPHNYKEWNTNQAVAIYRPFNKSNTSYLLYYLLSEFSQRWLYSRSKQTSGQVNLTLEMCNNLEVPLPLNEKEISAISSKLTHMFEKIRLEKESLSKLKNQKSGLMHDLLTGKVQLKVEAKQPEAAHV